LAAHYRRWPVADAPMLEIHNLVVDHGQIKCLRGISMMVKAGEIVTLIGSNGAGKTTTLKTISGLYRPKNGQIRFEGEPIQGLKPDAIVARGVVQVLEGRRIFPELSVEDNLRVAAHLMVDRSRLSLELSKVFERFPRLKERRRQDGGTLSGGEQQMLAFGRAMMARPRLLLLDEPTLGLAPIVVAEIMRTIVDLKNAGITILLVEQNARFALSIADRGYVMETGEIQASDTSTNLAKDPRVMSSYFGIEITTSTSPQLH
jgi:branched-chain amino acid transport system ATP-binding protein